MSISAYPIGNKVWLIRTEEVAQQEVPETLPLTSVVLEPGPAVDFYLPLGTAITKATERVCDKWTARDA